jgi:hypothetical protein
MIFVVSPMMLVGLSLMVVFADYEVSVLHGRGSMAWIYTGFAGSGVSFAALHMSAPGTRLPKPIR